MTNKAFIDTDVLIDFLIDRQPHVIYAVPLFNLSEKGEIGLYSSSLCFNNIHYIIRKIVGDKKARSIISDLMDLVTVLEVSEIDIRNATHSSFKDFEDAIQYSVAERNKSISVIITRNSKDYKKSELPVFTPKVFLQTLNL